MKGLGPGERTISAEAVDAALSSSAIDRALEGWTRIGREEEEDSLLDRLVVYATIERDHFTLADLLEMLHGHGVQPEPQRLDRSLKHLELAYVIESAGASYTYAVPLFVRKIRQQGPEELLAAELKALG